MPALTPNQIVAYNLRAGREVRGWTQAEAADHLAPHLGTRWSEAVFSAAERSVDGKRIREFTADDLVALSSAFGLPIAFFFLPPRTTTRVPLGGDPESFADSVTFVKGLLGKGYAGDVAAPEGADTVVVDAKTPAGTLPAAELLQRLVSLDDTTLARFRALAESLPAKERKALFEHLSDRETGVEASRLGNVKKHSRALRELANLLDPVGEGEK